MFIIRGLHEVETDLVNTQGDFKWGLQPEQITRFTEKALAGKTLCPAEDFYFEGAEGKQVHGFVVKPYGWKEADKKKWPGVLLIHGGMLALANPMNIQVSFPALNLPIQSFIDKLYSGSFHGSDDFIQCLSTSRMVASTLSKGQSG